MTPMLDAYRAVSTAAVLLDRSDRVRLDLTGPDRARFLHNLTTQDIKRLAPGAGCEAFITSPQGKTLGYITVLAADDRIILRTDLEGLAPILPHLQKYGVFDDVTLDDASARTFALHVAGPRAEAVVTGAGASLPDAGDLRHALSQVAGVTVRVIREAPTGHPGLTLLGDRADLAAVRSVLDQSGEPLGLVSLPRDVFEVLRIEAGTPAAGRDVTPDNLPQEVARDRQAINFVKGCYLGQETVARIDALGHVNKLLRGLQIESTTPPPPGARLDANGKAVGTITSATFAPARGLVVALGYVRTTHAAPGIALHVLIEGDPAPAQPIRAVVTDLPMPPV